MRLQLHRHERSRQREVNRILRRCFVTGVANMCWRRADMLPWNKLLE
ncbi:hypothetical protein HanRHA438_Chr14g0637091 [Helianthus annuus]|uniref:Uncharacterized protein n=1 Tax=Helianthus annuus TaxID=4232 RepID=A0A9K3E6J6_HELAN|nr:hypothetical protein HanXRQr2_Chr14g0627321 [Helianthus annuus]KAJ0463180.1 hypothetical protein HanHA300_Chr14g0512321 [Helianthus annuus]KAJ0467048.1 hypothetical protein HanIR_Chr14g0678921 [Helianthus annuus]KAJ0484552.1 hypothetical protein HanHA89_Chr14g0545391 [Helianthus annuus]KAJ0655107.1 hypothetical protein HanLR1_Chr14g0514681 [Helianthus annuus]